MVDCLSLVKAPSEGSIVPRVLHCQAADVVGITSLFFVAVLLAATQDIAVDGWALTLLSKRNIGCVWMCARCVCASYEVTTPLGR